MDVLAKVFGDPSNRGMLVVMLVGLVVVVAGPWAIIRAVSRSPRVKPGRLTAVGPAHRPRQAFAPP